MLELVDKLKICKSDKPKTWLSGGEGDVTELEDAEDEVKEVRRTSEEHGDEIHHMEEVEHATTDEDRVGGGSDEKPGGQEAATNPATGEHSLGPTDDPRRPTRNRHASRRLLDYVRAVHAATIQRSPTA